ncbi:hypothetical protein [Leptothermofonsia sp. ETS-13]|uniref:hypothetical protein n=1 Tax=Leptothermofonsia sp. ETS-13 TaxID=3035696 RepID=UPI003B9E1B0A
MLAVTMLLLSVQGQHVVMSGKRRWVDVHWKRGNSYVRIGWNWLRGCLHKDWALFPSIELQGETRSCSRNCIQKASSTAT